MSILSITHLLPTFARGGAERMVFDVVTRLDRQKFAADVVAMVGSGPLEGEFRVAGIGVTVFKKKTRIGLGVLRSVTSHLKRRAPTILHAHLSGPEIWGTRAAEKAGVPATIITVHNTDRDEPKWRLNLRKKAWARAVVLVVVSEAVREYLVSNSVPTDRIRVIPNGIDISRFPAATPVRGERAVICSVGRLEKQKGHDILLQALANVKQSFELRIAGEGSKQKTLERLAKKLGLADRVRFDGDVKDIPAFLRGCNLFAFPSRWEGQGIALLEAAASGLPIVASAVDGTTEALRDGESARLVPPEDPVALAEAISWMLEHPDDAKRMGEQARKTVVERFSVERMVAEYSKLYEDIAGSMSGFPLSRE